MTFKPTHYLKRDVLSDSGPIMLAKGSLVRIVTPSLVGDRATFSNKDGALFRFSISYVSQLDASAWKPESLEALLTDIRNDLRDVKNLLTRKHDV